MSRIDHMVQITRSCLQAWQGARLAYPSKEQNNHAACWPPLMDPSSKSRGRDKMQQLASPLSGGLDPSTSTDQSVHCIIVEFCTKAASNLTLGGFPDPSLVWALLQRCEPGKELETSKRAHLQTKEWQLLSSYQDPKTRAEVLATNFFFFFVCC